LKMGERKMIDDQRGETYIRFQGNTTQTNQIVD